MKSGGSGVDGGESSNTARGGAEVFGGVGFETTTDRGADVEVRVRLISPDARVGGAVVTGGGFWRRSDCVVSAETEVVAGGGLLG